MNKYHQQEEPTKQISLCVYQTPNLETKPEFQIVLDRAPPWRRETGWDRGSPCASRRNERGGVRASSTARTPRCGRFVSMPSGGEHVITVHGEPAGSAGALSTAAGDATQPERIDRLSGSATNDGVSSSEAGSSAPPSTTPSVDLTPAASDAKQPSPPAVSETAKQPPPPAALEKQPSRLTTHRRSLAKGQVPDELPVSFSKYDLAPKGIDRFVIHPDNKFKVTRHPAPASSSHSARYAAHTSCAPCSARPRRAFSKSLSSFACCTPRSSSRSR